MCRARLQSFAILQDCSCSWFFRYSYVAVQLACGFSVWYSETCGWYSYTFMQSIYLPKYTYCSLIVFTPIYTFGKPAKTKLSWDLAPCMGSCKKKCFRARPVRTDHGPTNHEKPLEVFCFEKPTWQTNKENITKQVQKHVSQKNSSPKAVADDSWWMLALRCEGHCFFPPTFSARLSERFATEHWCAGCIFETSFPPCSFDDILPLYVSSSLRNFRRLHTTSTSWDSISSCERHPQHDPSSGAWGEACKEDAPVGHTHGPGVATPPSVPPNCWPLPQDVESGLMTPEMISSYQLTGTKTLLFFGRFLLSWKPKMTRIICFFVR